MAFNLYLSSYLALGITNYIFVAADSSACAVLERLQATQEPTQDLVCVTYFDDGDGNVASAWGMESFRRKTHYKTKIILDTLRLGIGVIIVDLDIVFFRNPLPYLDCRRCDVEIQSDGVEWNSGFYSARPTRAAIELHEMALAEGICPSDRPVTNQIALEKIVMRMIYWERIRVRTLSVELFPYGAAYFEERRIMFAGDGASCEDCVIVHNNWIKSEAAKIYRFKETGLWRVDADGYYSDPSRAYLSYENPIDFGINETLAQETQALKAALFIGHLLNRTVILPDFHCFKCVEATSCKNPKRRCSLSEFYEIASFDAQFGGAYREHVFLQHAAVPANVIENQSRLMLIAANKTNPTYRRDNAEYAWIFRPKGVALKPSEILMWFGRLRAYSVLRFHSLYGIFTSSFNATVLADYRHFGEQLSSAFVPSNYRQKVRQKKKIKKRYDHSPWWRYDWSIRRWVKVNNASALNTKRPRVANRTKLASKRVTTRLPLVT